MKIFKQTLAVLLGVLSVAVFVLCIAATIAVWKIQPAFQEGTTRTFDKADNALEIANRSLLAADEGLKQAKSDLETIKTTNLPEEPHPVEPTLVNQIISATLVKRLGDRVHGVNETVSAVTDASIILNSLMEGLNRLPDSSLVGLNTDQLKQVQHSLGEVVQSSHELNALIELSAPEERGNLPVVIQASIIDRVLARLIDRVGEFRAKVTGLQAELNSVKARMSAWIKFGPGAITVIAVWLGASQISMFLLARSWWQRVTARPPFAHPTDWLN